MADSMCGPSNALQSFQKHSTVDRTLQQDRLVARQSPSQGFRSSAGTNSGLVDHEFEAFQVGQLPLDYGFQPQPFSPPSSLQQAGPLNWASDFQRMNISSPPLQLLQQPFGLQVQQGHEAEAWHQEFSRQQNPAQSMSQIPFQRYNPMSGMMASQLGSGFSGFQDPQVGVSIARQTHPEEAFDDEAFARAFEEAAKAELEQDSQADILQNSTSEGVEMGQDIMIEESAERLMASDALAGQKRIGADAIYDPVSEELGKDQEDPDALAKTAGHLLESIQYDQSAKFQNSQFFELMRQFRDGIATVQGDKVVGLHDEYRGGDEALEVAAS